MGLGMGDTGVMDNYVIIVIKLVFNYIYFYNIYIYTFKLYL